MQRLAEVCIQRPVFAAMLILALVAVGATAYTHLGVDRLPSVDLPTVSVRTSLPGASPEEVETEVSQIIEEAVNTVEGIEELRSISGQGNSIVLVTFRLERDIEAAAQDVRDRVATAVRRWPAGAEARVVSKFDSDSAPVLTIALSGELSARTRDGQDGQAATRAFGGCGRGLDRRRAGARINVWVDADRLAAFGFRSRVRRPSRAAERRRARAT